LNHANARYSNLGRKPHEVSADSGFASEANLAAMQARRITMTQTDAIGYRIGPAAPRQFLPYSRTGS